jgi:hypothetical protein
LKALQDYARRNRKLYAWEGTAKFAERKRRLSTDQYEIVNVCYSKGVRSVMLFPKAILKAEWEADAPLRQALGIRRAPKKDKEKKPPIDEAVALNRTLAQSNRVALALLSKRHNPFRHAERCGIFSINEPKLPQGLFKRAY